MKYNKQETKRQVARHRLTNYCSITTGKDEKTDVVKDNLNPEWNKVTSERSSLVHYYVRIQTRYMSGI